MNRTFLAFALVLSASVHFGSTQEKTFEVAAVKINNSGDGSSSSQVNHGRLTFRNSTMAAIVKDAFGIKDYELSAPAWFNVDRYDINAKAPEGTDDKDIPEMVQSLLKERFKMVYHREPKEVAVYHLVVDKGGFKGEVATEDGTAASSSNSGRSGTGTSSAGGAGAGSGGGSAVPLATMSSTGTLKNFADFLARNRDVNRPVIDKTGIVGRYKMALRFSPFSSQASADAGPSLFKALQDQLGLRLEPAKGSIDVIVIDKMEKMPSQ
jgi:uncharacterized protein (TIGR03435 family)